MANIFTRSVINFLTLVVVAAVALTTLMASHVDAQNFGQTKSQQPRDGGQYIPTIWVDPDGCEHWVMDDGAEGYMTPNVDRNGIPICRRANVCGVMPTDQFFRTDSFRINAAGKKRLSEFFQQASATSFIVVGHTDSRASDAYNLRLSLNRANSVASVAKAAGARIADVRGLGERVPAATNSTAQGMAKNRRVEIICIQ